MRYTNDQVESNIETVLQEIQRYARSK